MKTSAMRDKLLDEIAKIPDDKVPEVFNFLHYFRLGLGVEATNPKKTLQLAGSWETMPEDEFNEFLNNIKMRRNNAFTSRRNHEKSTD